MSTLIENYDGYIIDQWGVLHDGARPYPGAADCLVRLRTAGKRIVVVSNSSRRESENRQLMARLGFADSLFDRILSAGEDARQALEARADPFHRALGTRCYAFTRNGDRSPLDGIGLEWVKRVEEADFLAVIGTDSPRRQLADYEAELQAGISRRLPMICTNPDLLRLSQNGTIEAPGVLARRYEALGGSVCYHGKPYPAIYRSCLDALGCPGQRVLAVGDSMEHDILGASRIGLRSALVAGGVHAAALKVAWGELPAPGAWQALAAANEVVPDYVLPAFVW